MASPSREEEEGTSARDLEQVSSRTPASLVTREAGVVNITSNINKEVTRNG
jgi:hypothetical protein